MTFTMTKDSLSLLSKKIVKTHQPAFLELLNARFHRKSENIIDFRPAGFGADNGQSATNPVNNSLPRQVTWSVSSSELYRMLEKERFSLNCNLQIDLADAFDSFQAVDLWDLASLIKKSVNNVLKIHVSVRTGFIASPGIEMTPAYQSELFSGLIEQILFAVMLYQAKTQAGFNCRQTLQLSDVRTVEEAQFWKAVLCDVESRFDLGEERGLGVDLVLDNLEACFVPQDFIQCWSTRLRAVVVDPMRLLSTASSIVGKDFKAFPICVKSQWCDFSEKAFNFLVDLSHRAGVPILYQARVDSFKKLAGGSISVSDRLESTLQKRVSEGFDGSVVSSLEGTEKANQIFIRRHQLFRMGKHTSAAQSLELADFMPVRGKCSELASAEIFKASMLVFSDRESKNFLTDEKYIAIENLHWLREKMSKQNPDKAEFLDEALNNFHQRFQRQRRTRRPADPLTDIAEDRVTRS